MQTVSNSVSDSSVQPTPEPSKSGKRARTDNTTVDFAALLGGLVMTPVQRVDRAPSPTNASDTRGINRSARGSVGAPQSRSLGNPAISGETQHHGIVHGKSGSVAGANTQTSAQALRAPSGGQAGATAKPKLDIDTVRALETWANKHSQHVGSPQQSVAKSGIDGSEIPVDSASKSVMVSAKHMQQGNNSRDVTRIKEQLMTISEGKPSQRSNANFTPEALGLGVNVSSAPQPGVHAAKAQPASVPSSHPTLNLQDSKASHALGQIVIQQAQTSPSEVRVKVHPEGMGDIVVSVAKQGDSVSVRLEANQMQTAQWLAQQTSIITDLMKSQGITVQSVQVAFGQAGMPAGSQDNSSSKRNRDGHQAWQSSTIQTTGNEPNRPFVVPDPVESAGAVNLKA